MRTPRRADRRARLALEGLEERKLLNADPTLPNGTSISQQQLTRLQLQLSNTYPDGTPIPASDRRISYQTPNGRTAVVTLYGVGSLKGSTVHNGVLDLVFNYTSNESRIIGRVYGGGVAPISSIRDGDIPTGSITSVGTNPIDAVILPSFALVDGGFVNLDGGVLQLQLYSIGRGSEVHVREGQVPPSRGGTVTSTVAAPIAGTDGGFATPGEGIVSTGTSTSTVGNVQALPGATASTASTLPPPPPGISINLTSVNAGPLASPPVGNAQVYSYDPALQALVRFDTVTTQPTARIDVPGLVPAGVQPAVETGYVGSTAVVLLGAGDMVYAYNLETGAPFDATPGDGVVNNSFTVANLPGQGVDVSAVDGIATNSVVALLVQAGHSAVPVDLAASLASGQAVKDGPAYTPGREAYLTGGATGLPGSPLIYVGIKGHFDAYQPNRFQYGVATLTPVYVPATGQFIFSETARNAFGGTSGNYIDAGTLADPVADPSTGLGSVGLSIARLIPNASGKNAVRLYSPTTFTSVGTDTLTASGALAGLSQSTYVGIGDAALIDVQGRLKRFYAATTNGLIINGRGLVGLVGIHRAVDTTVIGRPIDHVTIQSRKNVQLVSSARGANNEISRGGVTVLPTLPIPGPVRLA